MRRGLLAHTALVGFAASAPILRAQSDPLIDRTLEKAASALAALAERDDEGGDFSDVRTATECLAALALRTSACQAPLATQRPFSVSQAIESVAALLAESIHRSPDPQTIEAARAAAGDYLDALGRASERRAAELVLAELRDYSKGPFLVTDKACTLLFDEVQNQRSLGRPERMIPALLLLKTRFPEDARVLCCLGEAYGVASQAFNAEAAEQNFRQLLEVLAEPVETTTDPIGNSALLFRYLPELRRTGLLLAEPEIDTTAWFRRQILGYCETLGSGKPIGLWRLADPRLDRLYEQLVTARKQLAQTRCREILDGMLAIQPSNPVFHYAQAEVQASAGPEFSPNNATEHLKAFLELTDPAILGSPDQGSVHAMTASEVIRDLARFRLAMPRSDLEDQRIGARELIEALSLRSPDALFVAPDRKKAEHGLRTLRTKLSACAKRLRAVRESLDRNRANLPSVRGTPKESEFLRKIQDQEFRETQYTTEHAALAAQVRHLENLLRN